jgi:hypothetical protein
MEHELVNPATGEVAKVGDLWGRPKEPQLDPQKVKEFTLWDKALQNDPEATREYINTILPQVATPAKPDEVIAAQQIEINTLKETVQDLSNRFATVQPVTEQIRNLAEVQQLDGAIKANVKEYPNLNKLAGKHQLQAAALVKKTRDDFIRRAEAQFNGKWDQFAPELQQQVTSEAFKHTEKQIGVFAETFGPTPPTPGDTEPAPAVNDQVVQQDGVQGPRFQMTPDGKVYDTLAGPPPQPGTVPGSPQPPLPAVPVSPAPAGGQPPGIVEGEQKSNKFTRGQFDQFLSAKTKRMEGIV